MGMRDIWSSRCFNICVQYNLLLFGELAIGGPMGNNESLKWQEQYQTLEELSHLRYRVCHRVNCGQTYELCTLFIPQEQQAAFGERVKQRQRDRNLYIQRTMHYGKGGQSGLCGNGQQFTLLLREARPTLADHCRSRRARLQSFSAEEVCHVIRSVCLGLAYLKNIHESHGSVDLNSIAIKQEVFLTDPIVIDRLETATFKRSLGNFPSPQRLRQNYDSVANLDQHTSDLFSLGAAALQMHHLSRDVRQIYSRNSPYRNTVIVGDTVMQLIGAIADGRLREWVWTLMNPDERARLRIYVLINDYQVNVKKLRILRENPLKLKPEEELVEQIQPYADPELNKNGSMGERLKSQALNGVVSNRPSIIMPISHKAAGRFEARLTIANGLHSESIVNFTGVNGNQNDYNARTNRSPVPERSYSLPKDKVSITMAPQASYKPLEIPHKRAISSYNISQDYKLNEGTTTRPSNPNKEDFKLQQLGESLRKLSSSLKSFIQSQSQQLTWKRENMIIYDAPPRPAKTPAPSVEVSPQPRRIQFRKASSLYIDKIAPVIPQVQEEHSNLTDNQYVIEQYEIGTKYEGFKRNGKRNGTGKFFYSEGSCYDGDWRDNKMHGYGVLTYPNGAVAYQGNWVNDEFHGKGVLYNDDPSPIPGMLDPNDLTEFEEYWIMYEGEMKNGKRNGRGKLTFFNGEYFQGEFIDDEITGDGQFFSMNGKKVSGRWVSGRMVETHQ